MPKPIVAVPADTCFFRETTWHAAQQQYVGAALDVAGAMSFIIPALGEAQEIDAMLDRVDGVMITGSRSNVAPALYGRTEEERDGPFDPGRDATTLPMIRRAIERGMPLLCICRGIQELNVALGGTLVSEVHELEGRIDHRQPPEGDRDGKADVPQADDRYAAFTHVQALNLFPSLKQLGSALAHQRLRSARPPEDHLQQPDLAHDHRP